MRCRKDPVDHSNDTPDRRFWTAYDRFKFEQEARALRRAEIAAMFGHLVRRLRAALARAGAQPPKRDGARTATVA